MYYSKFKKQIQKGNIAAKRFDKFIYDHGYSVLPVTPHQDKRLHYDRTVYTDNKAYKVDIKSTKVHGFTVELVNNLGYDGWLYGKADIIAEVKDKNTVRFFKRRKLVTLVHKHIRDDVPCDLVGEPVPFKRYTRSRYNFKDQWVIIPEDLLVKLEMSIEDL